MTLVLNYHPLSSCCWKVLIALYELELPFEPRMVDFGDEASRAAFTALWPTGKIPLLQDGAEVVPETSIMIEYLDRKGTGAARLLPDDPAAALDVRLWDRLFDLYVMTPMQQIVAQELRPAAERDARTAADAARTLSMAHDMIETRLPGSPWAVGAAFSLADCAAAPALFYADVVVPVGDGRPRLAAYLAALLERPSVKRTIDEARPYFRYYPFRDRLPPAYRDD